MSAGESRTATAVAQPNIALVKYWGKRPDDPHNEPAVGSLSITLGDLATRTRVTFDPALERDACVLNGEQDGPGSARMVAALEALRREAGVALHAHVESENDFPTGAGLASSASGFAALVTAVDAALGTGWSPGRRSALARRLSGSAARSIFGGFVLLERTTEGRESEAVPLLDAGAWPLEVVVAVVSEGPKTTGSTEGMERSRRTSAYYPAWVGSSDADLAEGRAAVLARDFEALAAVAESSCMKMHAVIMTARPPLVYWRGATVECLHRVRELRAAGTPVFFTIDAGAQLKAVCLPGHAEGVAAALAEIPGVGRTLVSGLGAGARTVAEPA